MALLVLGSVAFDDVLSQSAGNNNAIPPVPRNHIAGTGFTTTNLCAARPIPDADPLVIAAGRNPIGQRYGPCYIGTDQVSLNHVVDRIDARNTNIRGVTRDQVASTLHDSTNGDPRGG